MLENGLIYIKEVNDKNENVYDLTHLGIQKALYIKENKNND